MLNCCPMKSLDKWKSLVLTLFFPLFFNHLSCANILSQNKYRLKENWKEMSHPDFPSKSSQSGNKTFARNSEVASQGRFYLRAPGG